MNKTLRSLSGLIDFECAVRWSSFKQAALELHKTPAAVSQQIKQLEQSLGFELFIRHARHLAVTEKGRELAVTVAKSLRDINAKVAALQEGDEESVLRISTTHSFAMKWLIPRLYRFTEKYPELDIRIDSRDQVIDLADASCDIAIRHCSLRDETERDVLFRDQLVVIYSPHLVKPVGGKKKSAALSLVVLSKYPLLYEGSPEDWLHLLKECKVSNKHYDFSRSYSHSGILVQAAVAGHGVALAPYSIAYEDVMKGSLHIFPCNPVPAQSGYRLLCSDDKADMLKIRRFKRWIAAEIQLMAETLA